MGKPGVLLALMTTAVLTSGCYYYPAPTPCPMIAQASAVSVTVAREYVPQVGSLRLKACQDGVCKEAGVELFTGTASIDQGCTPEGVCSATASPDGTMIGMLMLESLTEAPMALTATAAAPDGSALPVHTLNFRPRGAYPYGEHCGKFVTAAVILDAQGLRQAA
ncbi:hypothetical protein QK290_06090 [Pseudarthrobacter sp. AL07]|uniref:hypothetical protein n=1 Tax=unclassified Pseudarthrobacter TaxID=2647000 RepID=UPI00249A12C4|nr:MULTISPECIES: hypothetical protein [unclassified Pseudarthrobacter]MDI3193943.1 hypothetical protein [Pseudarthrobacter sp. AL20]MDI3208096.1 hypothetical protein [Pseudarthrobacter sp. AL07]